MTRRSFRWPLIVIAGMGLALPASWAAPTQMAPAKGPLTVTYYFLPG